MATEKLEEETQHIFDESKALRCVRRVQTLFFKNGLAVRQEAAEQVHVDHGQDGQHVLDQVAHARRRLRPKSAPLSYFHRRFLEPEMTDSAEIKTDRFEPRLGLYDTRVLRFNAFFDEPFRRRDEDQSFIRRHVHILYYLADNTIAINEPRIKNSGLIQGRLLRRQRIEHPDRVEIFGHHQGDQRRFWHWTDLKIGLKVRFYGREYIIDGCDAFTRQFMVTEGVLQPHNIDDNKDKDKSLVGIVKDGEQRHSRWSKQHVVFPRPLYDKVSKE